MTILITVILAMATTLFGLAIAIAKADIFKYSPAWLAPVVFTLSGSLYLLALGLAIHNVHKDKKEKSGEKEKEIRRKLAALLKQDSDLRESLRSSPNDATFTQLIRQLEEWVNSVVSVINEAGYHTEAEAFRQVGYVNLTPEQISNFVHIPEWKRDVIARQLRYRQTLDQIISNRRL